MSNLHYLPTRLNALSRSAWGQLGTSEEIATRHSAWGFWLSCTGAKGRADALEKIAQYGLSRLRSDCSSVGFRQFHRRWLHSCDLCAKDEIDAYGASAWKTIDQHPLVWRCPTHQMPLRRTEISLIESNRLDRNWLLPCDVLPGNGASPHSVEVPGAYSRVADRLQTYALDALSMPSDDFNVHQASRTYLAQMLGSSAAASYRPSVWVATQREASFLRWLQSSIPGSAVHECGQGTRRRSILLNVLNGETASPLVHLALQCWLFGSRRAFLEAYQSHA